MSINALIIGSPVAMLPESETVAEALRTRELTVVVDSFMTDTAELADYVLPTAVETPPIMVVHTETPSPLNPLGVKGLGEGGAIAPPVAIANAVCDALKPLKTEINATPVRPADIVREFLKGD